MDRTTLGRYEIVATLSAGGMGVVQRAVYRDADGVERQVAVKRLHPHLLVDREAVECFLHEARLGAWVRHPNVVPILDVDIDAGEPFLVMELVEGHTLHLLLEKARARGAQVPIPIVSAILQDMLAGLQAAHDATDASGRSLGIIHRDVSPHNVIVGTDGVGRLIDFGLAGASDRGREAGGAVRGKLRYLAPEQLAGGVTQRTDLYSASVVLWEALTGTNLLRGTSESEIIEAAIRQVHLRPSALRAEVSGALEGVVMTGLSRAPELRFARAEAMRRALEEASPRATAEEVRAWAEAASADTGDAVVGEPSPSPRPTGFAPAERSVPPVSHPAPTVAPHVEGGMTGISLVRLTGAVAAGALVGVIGIAAVFNREPSPPPVGETSIESLGAAQGDEPSIELDELESTPPESFVVISDDDVPEPAASASPATTKKHARPDCRSPFVALPDGRRMVRPDCAR